jgi:D-xylose transport system ATP-binding protein
MAEDGIMIEPDSTTPHSFRSTPLLQMQAVGKSFPGVRALDAVSFDLFPGELHALVGENGAGKSTLMKVLGGVYPAGDYDGKILIEGAEQRFAGVRDAERAGIAIVFQELSLVPQLSVAENIFLGRLPARAGLVDWMAGHQKASALLKRLGVEIPTDALVATLGIAQQQLVEIAKALSHDARVLVLDEPTTALNDAEAKALFLILESLRNSGMGLIYISHRLEEVLYMADRITVLRDGRSITTRMRGSIDRHQLVSLMVGREISQVFPDRNRTPGAPVLEVRNLQVKHPIIPGRYVLSGISFELRAGEVLGIAGLMGSGRTALLNVLFGSFPERTKGKIRVAGTAVDLHGPGDAIRERIAFVTEDRKRFGLSLIASVLENTTLAALPALASGPVLRRHEEVAVVERSMKELRIKAPSPETIVGTLSGGNQQKVVLARWLLTKPRILLLDEPTRGIDVAAKQEIYRQIDELASQGLALLVVSSEMEELLGLCDRILVMHEGRITGRFNRDTATSERIMACATGTVDAA